MSHSEEQQRRIQWVCLRLPQSSGQQGSALPGILDADIRIGGGVFTGRIRHGISASDRISSNGWRPQWRGEKGGSYQKEKLIKIITRSWYHSLLIPMNYNVRLLCSLPLSLPCWVFVRTSFLRNPKPKNPGKLSWNAPRIPSNEPSRFSYIDLYRILLK